MSTPLARFQASRATGRITWRSVLGILLVPLVVAGVLVWAFWNPQERLDTVDAAIVNLDEPVELDGQTVPLGRQLAAGLVGGVATESASSTSAAGSDLSDTNYNWVLTDREDADAGLTSGRFTAVVTIPENFSAAATSFSGDPGDAEKATIEVETSDKSRLVDDAISTVITSTAASLVGNQLTTSYLENIYVGFNTLGDELGTAADGAAELATGAASLADGTEQLASGTAEFSSGASSFSTGVAEYTSGVTQLSSGLTALQQNTASLPAQTGQLATGATGVADGVDALVAGMAQQGAALQQLSAQCAQVVLPVPETRPFCAGLAALAAGSTDPAAAAQTQQLAAGARQVADGTTALAAGMPALTSGISSAASGAAQLASSGTTVSSGALELATGAANLASGASGVSEGAEGVAGGVDSLASGLGEATDAIPSYTESERETLADVVATPVVAEGSNGGLSFGAAGVPFFAALALWLGAFASFLVLLAVPKRVLGSTRPSTVLALKAWVPGAVVGVLQGVLVAGILQPLMQLDTADWFGFAAVAALAGVAFASTNQALNAVFGGAGRFISMVVALVLIGTSIIATAPAVLDSTVEWLPLQPALNAFQSIVTGGGGLAPAIVGLVLWTLGALAATTLAVVRSRSVTVRQLVPHTA